MQYILGIDLGTSYFKLGLFDQDGKMAGLGRVPVQTNTTEKKVELPTEKFWQLLHQGLSQACQQASTVPDNIKAVSYSSQANTFLLLDKDSKPLTPLILWTDDRVENKPDTLFELASRKDFMQVTGQGQRYTANHMASKLYWFKENDPRIFSKTKHVMTISDYLTWALTGQYISDAGTAALTAMTDVQGMKWWPEVLNILSMSEHTLGRLVRPGTKIGTIGQRGYELLGLPQSASFFAGSLDHHVAAVGAGLGEIADMSESSGTVLACINLTRKYAPKTNVCIGPGTKKNQYWQLTWDMNGAIGVEWYQRNYAKELTIEQLLDRAQHSPAGCDGLIAKPMCWTYPGLSGFENAIQKHHHGHFVRAVMESTAVTLKNLTRALCGHEIPKTIVATGGGAKSELWLKIKSETIGTNVIPSDCQEPACRGASLLAAAELVG